jgi:hypothetical protein
VRPYPLHITRLDALTSPVPLPLPLLHLVGQDTAGGRTTVGAQRVVPTVSARRRALRAWAAQAAFDKGPGSDTPAN